MKKLVTLALLTAMLPASAAITDTGKRMDDSPSFINSKFTYGNKPLLIVADENYDEDFYKFTILDKSFSTVKEFSTPKYPEVSASYTIRHAIQAPIGVYVADSHIAMERGGMTAEEFINWCTEEGFTRTEKHDEQTWYLPENPNDYYYYEYFGFKYPNRYRVHEASSQIGQEYYITYGYDHWGNIGLYGEPEEETRSIAPNVAVIYPESEECSDMAAIYLTQTLFNTDEAFEWVIPTLEAVDVSYTNEYAQVTGKEVKMVGFKVVSDNGSTVAEVRFPSGFYANDYRFELDILIVDDTNYLMARVQNDDETENFYIVYEVTPGTNSIKMVGEPMRVKVHPTAPVRGTDVEVELGETVGERCTVSVVSASGRTVMNRNIEPGTTHTTINTGNMQQGVYIVNINDERGKRTATKIVIR